MRAHMCARRSDLKSKVSLRYANRYSLYLDTIERTKHSNLFKRIPDTDAVNE